MDGSDYLNTVAQVSVAFVGFAAIALAIRHRLDEGPEFHGMVVLIVERGLAALGFALLPTLLHYFEVPTGIGLALCSGLLAAYLLSAFIRLYRVFFGSRRSAAASIAGGVFRLAPVGVMIPVQALAAARVLPFSPLGLYLLGVSFLLFMAGGVFSTILRRAA